MAGPQTRGIGLTAENRFRARLGQGIGFSIRALYRRRYDARTTMKSTGEVMGIDSKLRDGVCESGAGGLNRSSQRWQRVRERA